MSAIAAGVGGLRKTGGAGVGGAAASSARTFAAPSAGTTQPAAAAVAPVVAARTFGAPKPAAAAATVAAAPVRAAPKAAAPAPVKPKDDEGWQALQTPDGIPYYHNKITNGECAASMTAEHDSDTMWMGHHNSTLCLTRAALVTRCPYLLFSVRSHFVG
jgi:hypothetical protein